MVPAQFVGQWDALAARFESAWRAAQAGQSPPPDLAQFLPDNADRASALIELLYYEMDYRILVGSAPSFDDYLVRYPELRERDTEVVELRRHEAACRARFQSAAAVASMVGSRVGVYELRELVASGGMGDVFAARDTAMHRDVAIKILQHKHAGQPALVARFVEEAQITGQLQHPGIPPIHQVGTLPDGRPYLAMKLVRGETLQQLISTGSAINHLAVFEAIAQAVGFAHANGVIHRDLKPQNIMVGTFGEVQVMDWGLAKQLAPDERSTPGPQAGTATVIQFRRDATTRITQAGSILGTPAYMAPEQAAGANRQIDQRSDVFGLGSILCAMLTGQPPFNGGDILSVQAKAEGGQLKDTLARLDVVEAEQGLVALCRRCLALDPADRPADGNAVAAEVARLRADAEQRAKNAELARARTEVSEVEQRRRRRSLWRAGGIIVVVLGLGLAGTIVGLVSAKSQEHKAVENAKDANAQERRAMQFSEMAMAALRATTGYDVEKLLGERKELSPNERAYIEAIIERWRSFAAVRGTDRQSRTMRAEGHFQVATLWLRLGRINDANHEFESAVTLQEELVADYPAESGCRAFLVLCRNNYGHLLVEAGKYPQAEAQYGKALEDIGQLALADPLVPIHRHRLATCHNSMGILLRKMMKTPEAATHHRAALRIQAQLTTDYPDNADYRHELARSHFSLANLLALDDRSAAERHYLAALPIDERLAADSPNDLARQRDLALIYNNFGRFLARNGRFKDAEALYLKSLPIRERLAVEFPSLPEYQVDLGGIYCNIGLSCSDGTDHEGGIAWFNKAIQRLVRVSERFPNLTTAKEYLRISHEGRATAFHALKQHDKARQDWDEAIGLSSLVEVPRLRLRHAIALRSASQIADALAIIEELTKVPTWESEFSMEPESRLALAAVYCDIGVILKDCGKSADSLAWFDKAIPLLSTVWQKNPELTRAKQFLGYCHRGRASALNHLNRFAEAILDLDKAIPLSLPNELPGLRATRTASLIQADRITEAVAEVNELTETSKWNAGQWYDFSCVFAIASSKVSDKHVEYADRAMELLRESVKAGYKNATHLKTDPDLAPLRRRSDFQKLVAELE